MKRLDSLNTKINNRIAKYKIRARKVNCKLTGKHIGRLETSLIKDLNLNFTEYISFMTCRLIDDKIVKNVFSKSTLLSRMAERRAVSSSTMVISTPLPYKDGHA